MPKNTSGLKRGGTTGRKRGTPNKVTRQLKDMILTALDRAGGHKGGVGYLTWAAKKQPRAFLALVGRVLPLQVTGGTDNKLTIEIVGISSPVKQVNQWPGGALENGKHDGE